MYYTYFMRLLRHEEDKLKLILFLIARICHINILSNGYNSIIFFECTNSFNYV